MILASEAMPRRMSATQTDRFLTSMADRRSSAVGPSWVAAFCGRI